MSTIIHKPHHPPAAPEPEGFAEWWAQWPSRTMAAGRRAHYAEAFASGQALERERWDMLLSASRQIAEQNDRLTAPATRAPKE